MISNCFTSLSENIFSNNCDDKPTIRHSHRILVQSSDWQTFPVKGRILKILSFGVDWAYSLCHKYSTLSLPCKSSHSWYVNESVWLDSKKAWVIATRVGSPLWSLYWTSPGDTISSLTSTQQCTLFLVGPFIPSEKRAFSIWNVSINFSMLGIFNCVCFCKSADSLLLWAENPMGITWYTQTCVRRYMHR